MRKTTENSVRKNTQPAFDASDIEYWRARFVTQYAELGQSSPRALLDCLISVDQSFNTVDWYINILNVRKGQAAIKKTKKVCEALDIYLEKKRGEATSISKVLKRQKLSA